MQDTFSNLLTSIGISGIIRTPRLVPAHGSISAFCPAVVPNRFGEYVHRDTVDGGDYYTYAEEFAAYPIAEEVGEAHYKDALAWAMTRDDIR